MPLVQISLLRGKSPQYIRAIADGVDQALTGAYNVPPGDRFQAIHQLDPGELIYFKRKLGLPYTEFPPGRVSP